MLRVVSLSVIPRGPKCLDDEVTLLVQLPPGSTGGPPVDRSQLRAWGLRSEVAYRMLIGLAYQSVEEVCSLSWRVQAAWR